MVVSPGSKQLINVQHAETFGYKLTEQFLISGIELEGFSQVLSRIDRSGQAEKFEIGADFKTPS